MKRTSILLSSVSMGRCSLLRMLCLILFFGGLLFSLFGNTKGTSAHGERTTGSAKASRPSTSTDLFKPFSSKEEIHLYVTNCLTPSWKDVMRYPDKYCGKDIAICACPDHSVVLGWSDFYQSSKHGEPWCVTIFDETTRPEACILKDDRVVVFGLLQTTDGDFRFENGKWILDEKVGALGETETIRGNWDYFVSKGSPGRYPKVVARYVEFGSSVSDVVNEHVEILRKNERARFIATGKSEFKWKFENIAAGGVRITLDENCKETAFGPTVIPPEWKGIPVTEIGEYAFSGFEEISKITLPNRLRAIGYRAFYGCKSVTSITIPSSVRHIGNDAFKESGLKQIVISESLRAEPQKWGLPSECKVSYQ